MAETDKKEPEQKIVRVKVTNIGQAGVVVHTRPRGRELMPGETVEGDVLEGDVVNLEALKNNVKVERGTKAAEKHGDEEVHQSSRQAPQRSNK